jgi:uncharacterized protein YjbJ (UPF0337 family)
VTDPRPRFFIDKRGINGSIAMNSDTIQGNWKQFTGKVRERWGRLTDDHMEMIAGRKDQLVGRIQEAYGVSRDEARRQVDEFIRQHSALRLGP